MASGGAKRNGGKSSNCVKIMQELAEALTAAVQVGLDQEPWIVCRKTGAIDLHILDDTLHVVCAFSEIGMRSIQSIGSILGLRGSPYCSIHSFARRGPAL